MSDTHDSIEVPKDWASDLLSGGHCPTTGKDCWTLLEQAVNDMQFAVALANEHLENSSLASLVAEKMLDLKDADPDGVIYVSEDGDVLFGSAETKPSKPRGVKTRKKRAYRSSLPSLDVMRQEAAKLGLDISKMGRQRRSIWAAIQAAKETPSNNVTEQASPQVSDQVDEALGELKARKRQVSTADTEAAEVVRVNDSTVRRRKKMVKTAPAIAVNPNPTIFPPETELGDIFGTENTAEDVDQVKEMLKASADNPLTRKAAELDIEDILGSEDSE